MLPLSVAFVLALAACGPQSSTQPPENADGVWGESRWGEAQWQ